MSTWLAQYQTHLTWLAAISALTFVISLATLPWLVARIPADYFCHKKRHPSQLKQRHPVLRLTLLILKNTMGWILLCGGFVMLFIPGQGVLTMAVGLMLMDYPGKFALERKIAGNEQVLKTINWLRSKAQAEPLIIDQD